MSREFNDLKSLFAYLEKQALSTLKNEIAQEAVETMQEHVQSDVYDVFSPLMYERTGKLLSDIDVEIVNGNTIAIESVRTDGHKDVSEIIETGVGYTYPFEYNGIPRPFTENTRRELATSDRLKNAMKNGMRKRGIDVQK